MITIVSCCCIGSNCCLVNFVSCDFAAVPGNFFGRFFDVFVHRYPCHLQIKAVLFLCTFHLRSLSFLSLLFFGTLHSVEYIFPFLLCLWLLFFSQLFVKTPHTTTLHSYISFSWGWFWTLQPVQCWEHLSIVLQSLYLLALFPWIYLFPLLYNCKEFVISYWKLCFMLTQNHYFKKPHNILCRWLSCCLFLWYVLSFKFYINFFTFDNLF